MNHVYVGYASFELEVNVTCDEGHRGNVFPGYIILGNRGAALGGTVFGGGLEVQTALQYYVVTFGPFLLDVSNIFM